ncbi:hypothetical protein SFRURICE_002033 [Spodoptera frugiperda]|nr:hypothetical protein SFRURICE_002033 [Spodoptera frugiperda]
MFWSGNYIVVRELNFLLKEENVTLTQVLEADDILQECKADNKALIQFLTKPEVLAELITLITEEPPKNVELAAQYRHANIACEVLTSHLSMLSDRLSMDATQMNRLCDFINRDPPLNPLLASYFSKTVEMLLERSPKQDCYLYHIVCLRVLDFFKSRRDFLPNLLRHMCTSAIADTFKYFTRLDDLFKKSVMEWFEEHQFLECLIQIVCGTYVPEEQASLESHEKADHEPSEKTEAAEERKPDTGAGETQVITRAPAGAGCRSDRERTANPERAEQSGVGQRARYMTCRALAKGRGAARKGAGVAAAAAGRGLRVLLRDMFTSPAALRRAALVHGCGLLRALLALDGEERSAVELAVAPHLPLLHQALLAPPDAGGAGPGAGVGAARLAQMAELSCCSIYFINLNTDGRLATRSTNVQSPANIKHALNNRVYRTQYARHLLVECDLLTRLMDVFEENQNNKSPRAGYMGHAVVSLGAVSRALSPADVLAHALRLPPAAARWAAFQDHSLRPLLHQLDTPLVRTAPTVLVPLYHRALTSTLLVAGRLLPVGEYLRGGDHGGHPGGQLRLYSVCNGVCVQFNDMVSAGNLYLPDDGSADDANDVCGAADSSAETPDFIADGLGIDDADKLRATSWSWLANDLMTTWEAAPAAGAGSAGAAPEGWAQFSDDTVLGAHDPFAPQPASTAPSAPPAAGAASPPALADDEFSPFWSYSDSHGECEPSEYSRQRSRPGTDGTDGACVADAGLEAGLRALELGAGAAGGARMDEACSVELANNLLTAMSAMSADAIANIVNANLEPADSQPPS